MMNWVWAFLCGAGLLWGLGAGRAADLGRAALESGVAALTLAARLAGGFMLWCGVLRILEESGGVRAFTRLLSPLMRRLFPTLGEKAASREAIAENFAANLLGMGNAATPAGLRAMRLMREEEGAREAATDAMCLFLVLNASSLELFPSTVVSLRAAAGSQSPASVALPTFLCSAVSTLVGGGACLLLARKGRKA